jgi:hypothetical protein
VPLVCTLLFKFDKTKAYSAYQYHNTKGGNIQEKVKAFSIEKAYKKLRIFSTIFPGFGV